MNFFGWMFPKLDRSTLFACILFATFGGVIGFFIADSFI